MFHANIFDTLIFKIDFALRTLFPPKHLNTQSFPALHVVEVPLSNDEKKDAARLMRVNLAGEVCAQALYQGQALTAKHLPIKKQMNEAAAEEAFHLLWCEQRLQELGSKPSILNPIWYSGSILLGAIAGLAGDKISLGFVAETERQVCGHLKLHLQKLPINDKKSYAILKQMHEDEAKHAATALEAGGVELPYSIKLLMSMVSKIMIYSSYYI